jgi:hypothetical protein
MPFNPSSFDPQNTFHVQPQAGGVFTPIDEGDPLAALRPDIGIQVRDVRGRPPSRWWARPRSSRPWAKGW